MVAKIGSKAPTLKISKWVQGLPTTIDKEKLYVQEQLILTLRLFHAVNLRSLTPPELTLENNVVTKLGENQYEQVRQGIRFGVYEQKYAIYPQASGKFVIPAQTYSAQIVDQRNGGFFNFSLGQGKAVRIRSDEKTFEATAKPANYDGNTWLPAKNLTVTESWSKAPEDIELGEPITRTITMTATGLASAQLPPLTLPAINGLKLYPDQPQTQDETTVDGIKGKRTESVAIVANQGGSYTLPEITLHWWDIETNSEKVEKIPARTFTIHGATQPQTNTSNQLPSTSNAQPTPVPQQSSPQQVVVKETVTHWGWIVSTLLFAIAWLFTLWLYLRLRMRLKLAPPSQEGTAKEEANKLINPKQWFQSEEKLALKTLANACHANNPQAVKAALITWAKHHWHSNELQNIEHILAKIDEPRLVNALNELEYVLYSNNKHNTWNGENLLLLINGLSKPQNGEAPTDLTLPALYN